MIPALMIWAGLALVLLGMLGLHFCEEFPDALPRYVAPISARAVMAGLFLCAASLVADLIEQVYP